MKNIFANFLFFLRTNNPINIKTKGGPKNNNNSPSKKSCHFFKRLLAQTQTKTNQGH